MSAVGDMILMTHKNGKSVLISSRMFQNFYNYSQINIIFYIDIVCLSVYDLSEANARLRVNVIGYASSITKQTRVCRPKYKQHSLIYEAIISNTPSKNVFTSWKWNNVCLET